jgi:hypothetical protein
MLLPLLCIILPSKGAGMEKISGAKIYVSSGLLKNISRQLEIVTSFVFLITILTTIRNHYLNCHIP